jgi:hypothetical protein
MVTAPRTALVELDERGGEANGAAYLVHMLLVQKAEADPTGRFAAEALRLKPVSLHLTDTGESAAVRATDRGLMITSEPAGHEPVRITAQSGHIIAVTKLALLDRWLITGPVKDKVFQGLVRDIATRRVRIGGLLRHYPSVMRFLWLVNVRTR